MVRADECAPVQPELLTSQEHEAAKTRRRPEGGLPLATAKAALDRATALIKRLRKDTDRNAWLIGRHLRQVAELELHTARGYASLQAYAGDALALSPYTAFQCMRIAAAFTQEVAAMFGSEKLDRALSYIAATPENEQDGQVYLLIDSMQVPRRRRKARSRSLRSITR